MKARKKIYFLKAFFIALLFFVFTQNVSAQLDSTNQPGYNEDCDSVGAQEYYTDICNILEDYGTDARRAECVAYVEYKKKLYETGYCECGLQISRAKVIGVSSPNYEELGPSTQYCQGQSTTVYALNSRFDLFDAFRAAMINSNCNFLVGDLIATEQSMRERLGTTEGIINESNCEGDTYDFNLIINWTEEINRICSERGCSWMGLVHNDVLDFSLTCKLHTKDDIDENLFENCSVDKISEYCKKSKDGISGDELDNCVERLINECEGKCADGSEKGNLGCDVAKLYGALNQLNIEGDQPIQTFLGRVIEYILGFTGSVALAMFVGSGFLWMTAGGNSEKTSKALKMMTWSSLGVVVILSSYVILDFIFSIFS